MIKNDLESVQPEQQQLNGIYRGVVEDNKSDPQKSGRCKIRIIGLHTKTKKKTGLEGIPTEELPWSEPVLSLMEGSVSGYGNWTVPLQGSHVFVFFEGGNLLQPRYFASAPGIPSEKSNGKEGFNDPDEQYPERTNESDFSRLTRGETTGTAIEKRENNLRGPEPAPAYNAEYPYNKVLTTSSGITVEYDDTPGAERIHIYHPSKTYIEINSDGRLVIRNTDDKFELVDGNKNVNINKDSTINTGGETVNTSQNDSTVNGANVNLNRDKGAIHSVVTTGHICAITGLPHPCGSNTCFAHMNSSTESGTTN